MILPGGSETFAVKAAVGFRQLSLAAMLVNTNDGFVGADDYLTKPFSIRELIARVKVIFRRHEQQTTDSRKEFRFKNLIINYEKTDRCRTLFCSCSSIERYKTGLFHSFNFPVIKLTTFSCSCCPRPRI